MNVFSSGTTILLLFCLSALAAQTPINSEISVTTSDSSALTANLQQVQQTCTLTVNREPAIGGTVTVNDSAYASPTIHNVDTSVTVVAVAAPEYRFTGWSGASTSKNSEISVTMSDNLTLTANFSQITYTLTIDSNSSEGGTVTVNGSTRARPTTHNINTSVAVVAAAAPGYRFIGWSGASTSASSEISVTMSDNLTLTADFQQVWYTLTVDRNIAAGGWIIVNDSTYTSPTTHNADVLVIVRVVPNPGYALIGWSGASTSANSEILVTMSDNRALTANFKYACTTGSFTDSRDGKTYCMAVMPDGKTWMSENLNYLTDKSWCYSNDASNCNIYGRLYTLDAARIACPSGWRLPTRADWNTLIRAAGGVSKAGRFLKATSPVWDGTDAHGFSALSGGGRYPSGEFWDVDAYGLWWTATEYRGGSAYFRRMTTGGSGVAEGLDGKFNGFSARCVME